MIPPQLLQTQDQFRAIAKLTGQRFYLVGDDNRVVHVVQSDLSADTVIANVLEVYVSELTEPDKYEMISQLLTKPSMYRRVSVQVDPLYERCQDCPLEWLYSYN